MNPAVAKTKSSPRKRLQKTPRWSLRQARGLQILEAPPLAQLDWIVHGFSTRPGGASELERHPDGRKSSERVSNLGFAEWDSREHVLKNRQKFFAALNANGMRVIGLHQIHSDIIHIVHSTDSEPSVDAPKADA